MPRIYADIESAIAAGTPPQYVAANLISQGWPPELVNEALNAWLASHGRLQKKTVFKEWLKKYRRKALPAIIALVTISVISSSILLLRPWPVKIMVDSAFGEIPAPGFLEAYTHQPVLILITSLLTVGIFMLGSLFGMIQDYLILRLGFWLDRGIKEESFRHILHLPLYHQERLSKGDYIYRQNNLTNSLSDLVLDAASSITQSSIMIIGVLAIMLVFNFKLTLIAVVVLPFLFVLVKLFGPKLGRISQELTKTASDTSSAITESIDNAETVQSYTLEEKQINKANSLWWRTYRFSKSGLFWSRGYRFSNSLLIILGTSAVMYFGGVAALNGQMSLGELLIFMTYMGYLLGPVEELAAQVAARNQKLVDVSRVYEVLTDHEGIENLRQDNHFPGGYGRIVFQNVSYSYNNQPVLNNINLTIEPTQKVGLIGPSGSGKSTILKLIPLFIEPTGGRILIDNVDIQTVSLKELRHRIAWISQSPQLFNETILENLADGDIYRQMQANEIRQAMAVAYVNEFTDRLPMGVNSTAGEGGGSLSGGQKQRIAIARGLLKSAPIVCMDEPTAALDSKSEKYIRDSISKLIANKTVLMVTHRKALLALMDKIYVLENGGLKDVNDYGGMNAYLQKIMDIETAPAETEEQQRQRQQQQQRLAQLQAENAQLAAQRPNLAKPKPSAEESPDGTIYIAH